MSRTRRLHVTQPQGARAPCASAGLSVSDVALGERDAGCVEELRGFLSMPRPEPQSAEPQNSGAEISRVRAAEELGVSVLGAVEPERAPGPSLNEAEEALNLLQVGELAKASGKTVRAIHLYEDLGLLQASERSERGRYRLFAPDSLQRVRWISKLQSLGLSLTQIKELVREHEVADSARRSAVKLKEVYLAKLLETQAKLRELSELELELKASLAYLSTCDAACEPTLPVDSCPMCARHPDGPGAPELVAGLHL